MEERIFFLYYNYCGVLLNQLPSKLFEKKITQKQADKVADKLDELIITPKISRLIRSLPEILEKENRERLQNLNKAH